MNKIMLGIIVGIGITFTGIFYGQQIVSLVQPPIDSPQIFKDKLTDINSKFSQLKSQHLNGQINMSYYSQQISALYQSEQDLYNNVRSYKWSDSQLTDYNYWYRGIMKFPSALDQEYQNLVK